ncbi:VWA domain-containing protein [bacterium]|nr:VWA domain-containing protein [bacterium]
MQSANSIEHLPVEKELATRRLPLGPGAVLGCLGSHTTSANLGRLLVRVRLAGPVAAVEVVQAFQNVASAPVELYYLFPLNSNATVSRFRAQVGQRNCELQVVPKEQAANLTRHQVPGFLAGLFSSEYQTVFCVPLGSVNPGETINIDLAYAELLPCWDGEFRFTFPMMMSGRFQSGLSIDQLDLETPVSLAPGLSAGPNVGISVALEMTGTPPTRVACSHPMEMRPQASGEALLEMGRTELPARDFTLSYRFGHEKNPQGVLRQGRQHFLYHLHAPLVGPPSTLPRHLIILMDVSDNASGARLEASRRVAGQLLNSIGPGENFSLVGFNSQLTGYETGIPCDRTHVPAALQWLQNIRCSGRADMSTILERVLQLQAEPGRSMVVVVLACGKLGNEPEIYSSLSQTGNPSNIRFNCVGIDQAVNQSFLRRLSGFTRGQSVFVGESGPDEMTMNKIVADTRCPLLNDLHLVDQGLGINSETFSPAIIPGLGVSDSVTVLGLKAGNGGLEARARIFSGHPWTEAVAPLASQNPAIGVVWAHLKAREMSDELRLITGPRASRLRDVSASLARDYRLVGDNTASVLTDPAAVGGATWLPSLNASEWKPETVLDLTKNVNKGGGMKIGLPPPIEDLPPRPIQPEMAEPDAVRPVPVEAEEDGPSGMTRKAVIGNKAKHEVKNKLHGGIKDNARVKPTMGSGKAGVSGKPIMAGKPVLRNPGQAVTQAKGPTVAVDEGPKLLPKPNRASVKPEPVEVDERPTVVAHPPEPTPPAPPQPPSQPVETPPPPPAPQPAADSPEAIARQVLSSNAEFRQAIMVDLKLVYQTLARCVQAGGAADPSLVPLLEKILRRLQPIQEQSTLVKEAYRIGVLCYQALRGNDPQALAKTQVWVQRFAKLF